MEFRVLGPLEVIDDGVQLPLGGPRQRLVLAHLLLDANRVVPTDRLIDRIWGDEPPDAARSALFAYVSRLKKLLGSSRIQARPPGYIVLANSDELDSLHFSDLIAQARRVDDPAARMSRLSEALELWRGDPLSDLAEHDPLRPALTRLQELRMTAAEDHAEAQLALGQHRSAVPALEALVGENRLRERLWSLLMLALYRSGRQADALAAFHRARTILAEELGIDPSPELRHLHEQVLNQDPALDTKRPIEKRPAGIAVASKAPVPIRLVLADDHYLIREGIRRTLASQPDLEIVAACADLDSLLATVKNERPDVVVTDIRMPPDNTNEGIRAAAALRETHPDVGVVVLSQYAEPAYALALLEGGSARRAYLLKERVEDVEQLAGAIRAVAKGGSVIDAKVVETLMAEHARTQPSPLDDLTERERAVLREMAEGKNNAAIAQTLSLTDGSVEKAIHSIFLKLGIALDELSHKRVKAVILYLAEDR